MIETPKLFIEWILPLLASTIVGLAGVLLYFFKRKIERKRKFEDIEIHSKAIDLYDKLHKSGINAHKSAEFTDKITNFNKKKDIENRIINEIQDESFATDGKIITQTSMNQIAAAELEIADAKLKSAIVKLKIHLDQPEIDKFDVIQSKWRKFAELQAFFIADRFKGGSIYSLIYCTELTSIIVERTSYLIQDTNMLEEI